VITPASDLPVSKPYPAQTKLLRWTGPGAIIGFRKGGAA
jgi:hypothetical protein